MRLAVAITALAACGRVNFDPLGTMVDGRVLPDGHTLVVIDTPALIRDTSIWDAHVADNFGGVDHVAVDATERALYWFDLSAVSASATVVTATVQVTTRDSVGNGGTIELYPMLEAWEVGTADGTAGVCNWTERQLGVPWSTPGALPPSRSTTVIGTVQPTATEQTVQVELAPSAVTAWIADPSTNFGFTVGLGTAIGHYHFHSLEGGPGPRLEIELE